MFSRIQELESKCSAVWQRGLDETREYRRLRRQSMESARDFLEKRREASVKTDEESLIAEIDSFLDELSAVYLAGTTEQRETIRSLIEGYKRLLGNISGYVVRCAIRLRQAPSPEFLLRG